MGVFPHVTAPVFWCQRKRSRRSVLPSARLRPGRAGSGGWQGGPSFPGGSDARLLPTAGRSHPADRKVGDDQIALKAVIFRKAVILPEEMFSDEIRGIQTFGEMTFA